MATVDYYEYIKSAAWRAKREEFFASGHPQSRKCYVCGKPRSKGDHVHHLTYRRLGCELPEDLAITCEDHHDAIHALHDKRKAKGAKRSLKVSSKKIRRAFQGRIKVQPSKKRQKKPQPEEVALWGRQIATELQSIRRSEPRRKGRAAPDRKNEPDESLAEFYGIAL